MENLDEPGHIPRRYKQIDDVQKARIFQAIQDGRSYRSIANELGTTKSTIERLMRRWDRFGDFKRKAGSGRPRKTSVQTDRLIIRTVQNDRFISASKIKSDLALTNISIDTIERRIRSLGEYNSYWAARKPFLRESNVKKRLDWCIAHQNWTSEQWQRVLWTDESPFVLRYAAKRRVWRQHNERYNPMCIVSTVKHDVKIMVWGCFAAHGVGNLHLIRGIMTKEMYHDIIENELMPSRDFLFGGVNCIVQQDNDPKHTAKINKAYWVDNEIDIMDWPAQSPDLNPIENLWSILDKSVSNRKPNTAEELFNVIQNAWNALPVDLLAQLVNSMPRRVAAVIAAGGNMTKY
jgi:transposase